MEKSDKAPELANGHCERASETIRRASLILEQTGELRESIARIKINSRLRPTTSVVLIMGNDGVLRVKKDG
jgi:hypothetical protein